MAASLRHSSRKAGPGRLGSRAEWRRWGRSLVPCVFYSRTFLDCGLGRLAVCPKAEVGKTSQESGLLKPAPAQSRRLLRKISPESSH